MFQQQAKAVEDAKKNLVKFLNGQSVPHEQKVNLWCTCILNSCLSWYRSYCWWSCSFSFESVGIHDVLSKSQGSSNSQRSQSNFDALLQMRSAYTVAKQRGVSLEKF
jgi:small subunit ribosomal protein S5